MLDDGRVVPIVAMPRTVHGHNQFYRPLLRTNVSFLANMPLRRPAASGGCSLETRKFQAL